MTTELARLLGESGDSIPINLPVGFLSPESISSREHADGEVLTIEDGIANWRVPGELDSIVGILDVEQGGTGLTSYTTGDIIYADGTNNLARLSIGSSSDVLTVTSGLPSWSRIVNANIDAAAAISYSKLNLTNSIVDGDIVSITSRAKLPSQIAYEDESNTFSLVQNFDSGIDVAGVSGSPLAIGHFIHTYTDGSAVTRYGVNLNLDLNIASAAGVTGFRVLARTLHTSGTVAILNGATYQAIAFGNGGTTTQIHGFSGSVQVGAGHTVTTATGLTIGVPSISGTCTFLIGLFIEAQSGATNNWAIRTEGGNIAFFGNPGVGGGSNVMTIGRATAPSSNPTDGVILFVDPADDAYKGRGDGGTVTTIAPA